MKKEDPELWTILAKHSYIDHSDFDLVNGRIDLRGVKIADPKHQIGNPLQTGNFIKIADTKWKSIDFTGSNLGYLRFMNVQIVDCVFDDCSCDDWRMWNTHIQQTSFIGTDLINSSLGGIIDGKTCSFREDTFVSSDFRGSGFMAANFENCLFRNNRLDKVDFQSSTFSDCIFEGVLREVVFNRCGFEGENLPQNDMVRVDFSKAKLRGTTFKGLNLDSVIWPNDSEHIIVSNYRKKLNRALRILEARSDLTSRQLKILVETRLEWIGPNQKTGTFNKKDLLKILKTESAVQQFISLLDSCESG